MGCFLACFSSCKHRKHRHLVNLSPSTDHRDGACEAVEVIESKKQEVTEESIKYVKDSKAFEELLSCNSKKVTFNLNGKAFEAFSADDNEEKECESNKEQSDKSKSIANLGSSNVASCPSKPICHNCSNNKNKNVVLEDGDDKKLLQKESSESLFSLSIDSRKQACKVELGEKEVTSSMPKCGLPNEEVMAVGSLTSWKVNKEEPSEESKPISRSNRGSCPPNYRYQDCDKEDSAGLDLEDCDLGDDSGNDNNEVCDGHVFVQPESSESLFSVSIDSRKQESSESLFSVSIDSRKQVCGAELDGKEVTSPMPKSCLSSGEVKPGGSIQNPGERSQLVDSVLNPVENLIHLKAVKTKKPLSFQDQDKENMCISLEPSLRPPAKNSKANANENKLMDQEIDDDASLSAWLVNSETMSISQSSVDSDGNSISGREDRPILGAVSIKELKQLSSSLTSRKSRNRSPNELHTMGTVGSYWSHTGQNGFRFRQFQKGSAID